MNDQLTSPKIIDELLVYLFDRQTHPLTAPMAGWLADSRRFITFVDTFRDKIRKKLRTMPDPERVKDLRLELETAYLLLKERSLNVMYEPQLGGVRAPDFSVSFTTSLTFMVEVTRMRTIPKQVSTPIESDRFADTLCEKLGQLLPQSSNVLIIGVETSHLTQSDIQTAMLRLQQRAEKNESNFWQRYDLRDRADFFRHYQRLSEILVRDQDLQAGKPAIIWVNPQAKNPLPGKVRTVLYRSHMA